MLEFAKPLYFILMVIPLAMIVWYIFRQSRAEATIQFSTTLGIDKIKPGLKVYLRHLPFVFRVLAIMALIAALARPQTSNSWEKVSTEGIDIMLSMDISTSMLAADLKPNRLDAAKEVAAQFINGRPYDNIGMVIFAGESFTQVPLTTDHAVLLNMLQSVQPGLIDDGTAIGMGLANAVSRLNESKAKSKVVILMTDGSNNTGDISPAMAADIAQSFGIRVYTIGVGTNGMAPYPVQTPFGVQYQNVPVEIDETTLKQIASVTGGQYFRATDNQSLKQVYEQIDQLEKTKMQTNQYSKRHEQYKYFALLAFLLLLIEAVLRYTIYRKIP
ncbi:MAG: vWA domain-containing protein [Bacteroidales bacterium]